jgi:DNA modification methylase
VEIRGDSQVLAKFLDDGITLGDALDLLPRLPQGSIDLFFTSPPYADARAYSRIHPDHYVEWFLPFARGMYDATKKTGSLILNIKNRVAKQGTIIDHH